MLWPSIWGRTKTAVVSFDRETPFQILEREAPRDMEQQKRLWLVELPGLRHYGARNAKGVVGRTRFKRFEYDEFTFWSFKKKFSAKLFGCYRILWGTPITMSEASWRQAQNSESSPHLRHDDILRPQFSCRALWGMELSYDLSLNG